ncbi:hypothetical protein SEHO0A_03728 [Salmonella enterica subsp. houtenae str. ATCC BAA-1581]|nr:hypothetical protein SEHO0A_03728 [Salmonella enterica subsp. houtenae str. ATCC BAA-1581]
MSCVISLSFLAIAPAPPCCRDLMVTQSVFQFTICTEKIQLIDFEKFKK